MSWLFSRALVAEYSAGTCSDGEPSAPSSVTPTPQAYWSPGKTTDTCPRFRYGMTFARLTADRGADVLTSFQEAFPARTFRRPAKEKESTASAPGCGESSRESFAKYDRDSCLWKTRQCLLAGDLEEFSETWPRWGSTWNGESYRRRSPFGLTALRPFITNGTASGLSLKAPTPTVCGLHNRKGASPTSGDGLSTFVKRLAIKVATPTACDWKSGKASQATMERNSRPLREQVGGSLNPPWVEWLMGWPIGWTDCAPLATDKFRQWWRLHGGFSIDD